MQATLKRTRRRPNRLIKRRPKTLISTLKRKSKQITGIVKKQKSSPSTRKRRRRRSRK